MDLLNTLVRGLVWFALLMVMPMVKVGPVDVFVCYGFVAVGMGMRRGDGNIGMLMVVVIVIVTVEVLMIHRNMPVNVTMFLAEQQRQGTGNEHSRPCLDPGERLTQE